MWLLTSAGFYSVVQKPGETELCIRARVREDLERLREYMPTLSATVETRSGDYRYRAWVSREGLAEGVARIAREIDYANFKSEVAGRDPVRGRIYGEVWGVLGQLQAGGPYS
jgi:hypothetical protein